jgi:hypothetical protein
MFISAPKSMMLAAAIPAKPVARRKMTANVRIGIVGLPIGIKI